MSKQPSFDDVMSSPNNGRRTGTARACFSPDLNQKYGELSIELEELFEKEQEAKLAPDKSSSRRLTDRPRTSTDVAAEMAALYDAHPEAFYELKFEQLERSDWLNLRDAHPPRDGNEEDSGFFNYRTFPPEAVKVCLIDPEPTEKVLAFFHKNLSNGEWDRLGLYVFQLNEGVRYDPKSDLASRILSAHATE